MKTVDIFWTKIYIFGICNMLAIQINQENLGFSKKILCLSASAGLAEPPFGVSWSGGLRA